VYWLNYHSASVCYFLLVICAPVLCIFSPLALVSMASPGTFPPEADKVRTSKSILAALILDVTVVIAAYLQFIVV
jgi:hypothetical protein